MNKRKQHRTPRKQLAVPMIIFGIIVAALTTIIVAGILINTFLPKPPSSEIKQVQASLDTLNLPKANKVSVEDEGCTKPLGNLYCFWAISYRYNDPDVFWPKLEEELLNNWDIQTNDGDGFISAENLHVCLMVQYSSNIDGKNVGPSGNKGYVRAILKGSNGCNH